MVMRLPPTEAFLSGKIASRELFAEAGKSPRGEVTPISDVRGSEDYRRTLAKNILVKFWHDIDGESSGVIRCRRISVRPWKEFRSEPRGWKRYSARFGRGPRQRGIDVSR